MHFTFRQLPKQIDGDIPEISLENFANINYGNDFGDKRKYPRC